MRSLLGIYDLRFGPATFDFYTYLAALECSRLLQGLQDIKLVIKASAWRTRSSREQLMSNDERLWRLYNILLPATKLLRSITAVELDRTDTEIDCTGALIFPRSYIEGRHRSDYIMPYAAAMLQKFYREAGIDPRNFKATRWAKVQIDSIFPKKEFVVLAPRFSRWFPTRNSDLEQWYEFYCFLNGRVRCIVVEDQECLFSPASPFRKFDWELYSPASMDIDVRTALYERARHVFQVGNGPSAVTHYSKEISWSQFDLQNESVSATSAKNIEKHWGVAIGGQYSFSGESQRFIWAKSSYSALVDEASKVL